MKGECEDKYGPVTAIKVIKDSQVCVSRRCTTCSTSSLPYREKFTSSLTMLTMPPRHLLASIAVGLVAGSYLPAMCQTLSCRHPSRLRKRRGRRMAKEAFLTSTRRTDHNTLLTTLCFLSYLQFSSLCATEHVDQPIHAFSNVSSTVNERKARLHCCQRSTFDTYACTSSQV